MSLVIAHRIGPRIRIVSDSRVSPPFGQRSHPLDGILKLVTIGRQRCLAFAGPIAPALTLLREVHISRDDPVAALRKRMAVSEPTLQGVDFLVGDLGNPTSPITRISNGRVESGVDTAWIGDRDAFSAFQQVYAATATRARATLAQGFTAEEVEWLEGSRRLDQAFDTVLAGDEHQSVGDFKIAVSGSLDGAFRYDLRAEGYNFKPVSNTTEERSLTEPVSMEDGGYYFSLLTRGEAGDGAVGAYFPQGRFGVLMHPLVLDRPQIYRNVSMDAFRRSVLADFAVGLVGIYPPGG